MHGIARVTSLKILGDLALRLPTHCQFLYTWTMSSTLLRGPCTPFASWSLTGCRCSVLLSSRSSPMPLRLGKALPHPLTASVLMLFFARTNLDSGHLLCHLTFLLLRITIHRITTIRPRTAYTHSFQLPEHSFWLQFPYTYNKTAINFRILSIVVHCLLACVLSCLL